LLKITLMQRIQNLVFILLTSLATYNKQAPAEQRISIEIGQKAIYDKPET